MSWEDARRASPGYGAWATVEPSPLSVVIELRRVLRGGRAFAHQRGPAHVARLVGRERAGAVHGLAVVPHDEVADPPLVRIDELALGGVLGQVAQEQPRLRQRPAQDRARVRGQVERFAAAVFLLMIQRPTKSTLFPDTAL